MEDVPDDDVNSVDTLPDEDKDTTIQFNEAIQGYKKTLYERVIPDTEDGASQTDEPVRSYEKIMRQDAQLLLRGEDDERTEFLSAEAKKYLLPFLLRENTHNEFIQFLSAIRLNLITFPFTRTVEHANNLTKNAQQN